MSHEHKVFLPLISNVRPPPDARGPGICFGHHYDGPTYAPYEAAGIRNIYAHNWTWIMDAPADYTLIYSIPLYYKEKDKPAVLRQPYHEPDLAAFMLAHRGRWWSLGNEFNDWASDWEPPVSTSTCVLWLKMWSDHLRSIDPTCRLAMGGLACTYPKEQVSYLRGVIDYWRVRYGVQPPFQAYDAHCYTNPGRMRDIRAALMDVQFEQLWCSEFGVLWDASREQKIDYMRECFRTFADLNVDRFFWFVGHWRGFETSLLWDDEGNLNPLGLEFRRLAAAYQSERMG